MAASTRSKSKLLGSTSSARKSMNWAKVKWHRRDFNPFSARLVHGDFKVPLNARLGRYTKSRVAKNIRVPAIFFAKRNRWGSGLDETVQTRLLSSNPLGFTPVEMGNLHQRERLQTTDLVWATNAKGLSPLSGHTPAIKSHQQRQTKGTITEEHGTRDNLRENAIRQETTADDWGIKSRLATTKYMISPQEELQAAQPRLSSHPTPLFSVHKSFGDLRQPAELNKFSARQQEVRETVKWHTASEMLGKGHAALVPDTFKQYLHQHGQDPQVAMEAFRKDANANPKLVLNRALTSQTDDLSSASLGTMVKTRKRALSEARALPQFKQL